MKTMPIIVAGPFKIKKNYIVLEKCFRAYLKKNNTTNMLINALNDLFNDHGTDATWLLSELLDLKSRGVAGSKICVKIRGDSAILEPSILFVDNPEDYGVEVSRAALIKLAQDWQALVDKKVPEIVIYCKDGNYFVSDTLPEGIE